jgi:hypothetical protein
MPFSVWNIAQPYLGKSADYLPLTAGNIPQLPS